MSEDNTAQSGSDSDNVQIEICACPWLRPLLLFKPAGTYPVDAHVVHILDGARIAALKVKQLPRAAILLLALGLAAQAASEVPFRTRETQRCGMSVCQKGRGMIRPGFEAPPDCTVGCGGDRAVCVAASDGGDSEELAKEDGLERGACVEPVDHHVMIEPVAASHARARMHGHG